MSASDEILARLEAYPSFIVDALMTVPSGGMALCVSYPCLETEDPRDVAALAWGENPHLNVSVEKVRGVMHLEILNNGDWTPGLVSDILNRLSNIGVFVEEPGSAEEDNDNAATVEFLPPVHTPVKHGRIVHFAPRRS